MNLTSFVTIRIGIELAVVQRKLPDYVVVGFQLYSARTFHETLSPRIYKGGQGCDTLGVCTVELYLFYASCA